MKIKISLILLFSINLLHGQSVLIPDINGNIASYLPSTNNFYPPSYKQSNAFTGNVNFPFETGTFNQTFPKGGIVYGNMDIDSELELIYHSGNKIYCVNTNGSNVAGFPISIPSNETIEWVPSYGDITGNGIEDIVFTSKTNTAGKIYAYTKTGSLINGFPLNIGSNPFIATLGDLDGDNNYEIIIGNNIGLNNGELIAFEGNGSTIAGFPYNLGEKIASNVAIGDINNNTTAEIIIETETKIWGFNSNGTLITGFPFSLTGNNEIFSYSSPILVDLDNDKQHEIIFASHETNNGKVYVLKNDGSLLTGWPQTTTNWIYASPLPVDTDNDGILEIVVGDFNQSEELNSSMYSFKIDGSLLNSTSSLYGITAITALDINLDGIQDFLIDANFQYGVEGKCFALNNDFQTIEGWPLETTGNSVFSPIVIGDFNQNGTTSIANLTTDFLSNTTFINVLESNLAFQPHTITNPFFQINSFHNGYIKNKTTTSIVKNNEYEFIKVYPNPSKGLFNITSKQKIKHLKITNISGKVLIEKNSNKQKENIDISYLPKGAYLLFVNTKFDSFYTKIIKN